MSSHPDSLHISSLEAEPGQGEKEAQLALESREKVTPSDIREQTYRNQTKHEIEMTNPFIKILFIICNRDIIWN